MQRKRNKMRSKIHMLTVAAARLEEDHANPKLIAALREGAREYATRRAEGRAHTEEEHRRIDRQRTLFNIVPDSAALVRLKTAMLQRAYDLLWDGDAMSCDALLEFLPSADVDKMLGDWERDQISLKEPSPWYRSAPA